MAASNTNPLRANRRTHLSVELLEKREVLSTSGYQPTVAEQVFLERLNDARANPAAYGASIGLDLSTAAPAAPLAFSPQLIQAARNHAWDMNSRNYFSHVTPEGTSTSQRIRNAGANVVSWGESLIAGGQYAAPEDALRGLIVDAGVSDLGHRRHLLAMDGSFRKDNMVGVGVVQNAGGSLGNYYAVDTGGSADGRAFVTGVVFRDQNGNGKYDAGEGLGGVSILVNGTVVTTTYQTGGYSVPLSAGTYTITATGGDLPGSVSQAVSIGSANVRVNITPRAIDKNEDFVRRLYLTALGRTASPGETGHWVNYLQTTGNRDGVAHFIERSPEARTRLVRTWYVTYLGRQAGNGEEHFWVQTLVNGATDEQVLTAILSSDEYLNRAASLYDEGSREADFMQGLYRQLLGRTAVAAEINLWVPHIATLGRHGIVNIFISSAEYRGRLLYNYYVDILGRKQWPTQAEVSAWAYSRIDLATIRVIFKASGEFYG